MAIAFILPENRAFREILGEALAIVLLRPLFVHQAILRRKLMSFFLGIAIAVLIYLRPKAE